MLSLLGIDPKSTRKLGCLYFGGEIHKTALHEFVAFADSASESEFCKQSTVVGSYRYL
ncbi:hypothetical protein O9992_23870 [Vibrio lentus]|nr:hypothetical protein [Vibrio lentus]